MKMARTIGTQRLLFFAASSFFSTAQSDAGFMHGTGASSSTGFVMSPGNDPCAGLKLNGGGNVGRGTADAKGNRLAVNGTGILSRVKIKRYGN